jgi:hypothetical protein
MNLNCDTVNAVRSEMKLSYNDEKIDSVFYHTKPIKKMNRRVQFHKVECTVHTIERMEFTEQMKESLWYQPTDCRKFRTDDKKLMRTYRGLVKRMHQTNDIVEISSLNQQIEQMEEEIRGLEDYKSLRAHLDEKHRRISCCHAVLKEQIRQRTLFLLQQPTSDDDDDDDWSSPFTLDATLIRNCVLDTSMKSKLLAFTLGLSDASYVRQINNECDYTTLETVSSDCDDQTMIILDEVEEEDQPIIAIVQPRCCDMDMTVSPSTVSKKITASSILRHYQTRYLVPSYVPCA